jgi:fatty acid desaturase
MTIGVTATVTLLTRGEWKPSFAALSFLFGLVGYSQNIGVVHECTHRLPPSPPSIGLATARFLHALGGLRFYSTRLAHRFHHAYLGTARDPDRRGYDNTNTTLFERLRYILFIGPIRSIFAPVDLRVAFDQMSPEKYQDFRRKSRFDEFLRVSLHFGFVLIFRWYYLSLFLALIGANMLSNVREMTEHGNRGSAAYVNIKRSLLGVLFLSTPGFWYHGWHHMYPEIDYWDLPLRSKKLTPKSDLPILSRKSYVKFMLFGN